MAVSRRVFVAGAAGRLGAAVADVFCDCDVIAHTRASLELTRATEVRSAVLDAAPSVIVNCAAFNDVDGAESRPSDAFAVNAFAVRTLARCAEEVNAVFVHYGSDFVFDGTATEPYSEDQPPAPQSAYGMSKLLGDWFALDAPRAFVLRVESLFGGAAGWTGRRGSFEGIVDGLQQGRPVTVFVDRVVTPSYVHDVALATRHLIDSGARPGLYHCVNSGSATWHDVAVEVAGVLGVPPRLEPITLEQHRLPAKRPRYCALSNGKLAAAGFAMPSWQDALRRWIAASRSAGTARDTMDGVHG
jgi:dTDP-4-dehydrorhamnose reductase